MGALRNTRLKIILASAVILLLAPLVAMQFTHEVNWDIIDFAVMGILLFGTGFLCEFVMRKVKSVKNRIVLCAAVLLMFFLIWAELAVGVFGTPFAGS